MSLAIKVFLREYAQKYATHRFSSLKVANNKGFNLFANLKIFLEYLTFT